MIDNDTITSQMTDTETFRQKVIDAGIRGKLTKQLPEDGNAEDLYQQIQEEKARLEKEGKIKKSKPLPPIKPEEIPFEIPKSWKWVRLGDIIELLSGQDLDSSEYSDFTGKTVYITGASCLTENGVICQRWTDFPRVLAHRGDLLLVCKGSGYGKTAFCNVDEAHIARQIMAIHSFSQIDLRFIRYNLENQFSYIKGSGQGIIPGIDRKSVLNMIIPLPSYKEQQRLSGRIDEIISIQKNIICLLKKYSANVEALESKVIDAGIQGKLTEQLPEDGNAEDLYQQIQTEKAKLVKEGKIKKSKPLPPIKPEEIPFEIPENWKWVRLGDVFETITGGTPSKKHSEYYGGVYPFFKPTDLDKGSYISEASEYLSTKGKEVSKQFPADTILLCCIGSIGKAAIIDCEGTANQQINAVVPNEFIDVKYAFYVINSTGFNQSLWSKATSTTIYIVNN